MAAFVRAASCWCRRIWVPDLATEAQPADVDARAYQSANGAVRRRTSPRPHQAARRHRCPTGDSGCRILGQTQFDNKTGSSIVNRQPALGRDAVGLRVSRCTGPSATSRPTTRPSPQVDVAKAQLDAVEQDLIVRVTQAYFDVLVSRRTTLTSHSRSRKPLVAEQLASAKRNFEVGTATVTDSARSPGPLRPGRWSAGNRR
ncbi:MAG: hypothetical protein MZW92_04190 [Comamonadaceae bacterium]|nr:hypothetical protein [Comamonadaceae bacterium]